ncbi:MAG TPA: glycosyltransferase family 4 protein [Chryseosolibacter sp.]|nr:glycosyltransferase family 4 protein [Chryseosolibacter sp.]
MNRLRIAQVAPLFESVPPKLYGGTERVVSFLTEELVRQGHDVTLFSSGDSLTTATLVPVSEKALRLDKNCIDPLAYHILQLQMVQDMSDSFDVIHYHTDYLHYPTSRFNNTPQVTTLHGRLDIRELKPLYDVFYDMPVVSISMNQRKPLQHLHWVGNVYHGLPVNLFKPNFNEGEYLAFLGRVSEEKGLDSAIAIAKQCGVPLKIAAKIDKADRAYFEHHIKRLLDHPLIEFVGEIGESEKNEFLGNAMALLFPINWSEPFGLVLIEAMACGTPVVAFNRGSVPEMIEHGVNGFIVTTEAEAAIAVKNISSVSRQQCRVRFEERFTAPTMAEAYVRLYEERPNKLTSTKYNLKLMQS